MTRSNETEQSVQYTVHSSSSPTSFRPHIWAARRTVETREINDASLGTSHKPGNSS
ncbi:hypothetical protein I79_023388 [Cricetulus griseus]|uniref:Uncharacterized protein n=1 Tax=Cricetulus griseus TaxID=10029 RepID=G3IHT3_CRIGR|nr:hypothetical protein I79_023388 [Cricetulus griseus]